MPVPHPGTGPAGIASLPPGKVRHAAEELARRLEDQPPGTHVPSDLHLAEQAGCSFTTAGKAKRALAAAGLITRDRASNRYRTS